MSESRSIDLHNFTVAEALREFVRFYNNCVRSGYRGRLEVIHGYGSTGAGGVIREELRKYLKAHSGTFGEFLAGESLRNPGVTILYPRESLATMPQSLDAGHFTIPRMKPPRKRR
jgi:dsDNA-specific endonuclease/ATPase MutS2